ncbi:Hypothetical protein, putative [Bodo saltans]|uniref:Uncharacterized protein n=1 Tax=Bodo saltans TaxID=75058 RepID=A0A0S4JAD6_BODSA|nr:Hypothetical protein, putative [Bodo saltans]|eukprot:CUG87083.1 Hypothetical protein, putative [Bodo saltans]
MVLQHDQQLTSSTALDSSLGINPQQQRDDDRTALQEFFLVELSSRATILGDEFGERGSIADGRLSLAEPGIYLCPAPRPSEFYASFLKRKRLELTEKYQDLITRQMLREERWLEYTVALLQELVEEETTQRAELLVRSLQDIPRLTLCHMQLQMVSAQGTEGTVIFVEEMEREIRFRVMIFEEVQAYETLVANEALSAANAKKRETNRLAEEHDARGCVGAAEWNARWLLEREEDAEFPQFDSLASKDRERITSLLTWRLVCLEADGRFAVENEWNRMLYPPTASSNHEDFHDAESPSSSVEGIHYASTTPLAEAVAWHDSHCTDLHAEVRAQRLERDIAATVAAQAFALNCPVVDDDGGHGTGTSSNGDDELSPPRLTSHENGEAVPTPPPLTLFGHRFDTVPMMYKAGEMPSMAVVVPQQASCSNDDDDHEARNKNGDVSAECEGESIPIHRPNVECDETSCKIDRTTLSPPQSENLYDEHSAGRCTDDTADADHDDHHGEDEETLSWDAVRFQAERVEALWRNLA